jgi:hypothetical protein
MLMMMSVTTTSGRWCGDGDVDDGIVYRQSVVQTFKIFEKHSLKTFST